MKKLLILLLVIVSTLFSEPTQPIWVIPVKDAKSLSGWFWENRGTKEKPRYHFAMDIPAIEGKLVYATVPGFVIEKGFDYGSQDREGWGNYVKIKDEDGNIHIYAHMSSYDVKWGEAISAGQVIGAVGHTGLNSCRPHLHYQVLDRYGKPVLVTKNFGIVWKIN